MNHSRLNMLLCLSLVMCLIGIFGLFAPMHNRAIAEILPTATPRHIAPKEITPTYKVYLPLVSTTPLDSFTLINMDLQAGVIDVNEATT